MKITMLDTATLGEDIDLSPIKKLGETVEYKRTAPEEVAERIQDSRVIVVNKIKLNEQNLKNAKELRLICVTATGYDNIDLDYCKSRSIALCNVPGYSTESVAQLTVAMALSLVSHLPEYRSFVHTGKYTASGLANALTPAYHEISSMTWGIVGGGAIGSRVAEIAKALGCRILMCRQKKDSRYEQTDIDTLCAHADIISLHVPLTEATRNMINRERIKTLKPTAVLINMARGAVADEEALAQAIEQRRLGGLGIDVYSNEPFSASHPFSRILHYDSVCLTPHMAWGSVEARARCISIISDNISAFFGGAPQNRII